MAVTHPTLVRNAIADLVVDGIDAGAGAGKLLITTTSTGTTVATLTFSDPAFGTSTGGVATASAITDSTSTGTVGGTAAKAVFTTSTGLQKIYCSVGTTGADINLSSVTISAGDTVSISSLTYTAPA
jgi:hypothetical protein